MAARLPLYYYRRFEFDEGMTSDGDEVTSEDGERLFLDIHSSAGNPHFHGYGGRMVSHFNPRAQLEELKREERELLNTMRIMREHSWSYDERGRDYAQDIDYNTAGRPPRRPIRSSSFRRNSTDEDTKVYKQLRSDRDTQIADLTERHRRTGQEFQEMMRMKVQQKKFNKMKERERKEYQERQLQAMENDLRLWQEELKNHHDMSFERASSVVEKKNAITSLKTQEKRMVKEMEHALMKSRVEEEARNRQQELKMLLNLKDHRSKMIKNAKAEYANAGRELPQGLKKIKNRTQDEQGSSFDKMVSCGEMLGRWESMDNSKKRSPTTKVRAEQSVIHLG